MIIRPHRTGSIHEVRSGAVWTPQRLEETITTRAAMLRAHGVGPGSRVLLARTTGGSFFADLLAIWRSGACAACVDAKLSSTEIQNVALFIGPTLALVDESFPHRLPVPVICSEEETLTDGVQGLSSTEPSSAELDDDALVLFTSGTTGDPKGVVHTFRSLHSRISLNRAHIGDRDLARTLCMLPGHFGHGLIGNCLTPLLSGHELHVAPFDRQIANTLGEEIDRRRITFLSSVPTMWRMLFESDSAPPTLSAHRIHVGSAPLTADLWRRIAAWSGTRDVVNAYGITEAANWIGGASSAEFEPADGLIGRAWGGELAVLTSHGVISPTGDGELLVGSPSLMRGYLQREDLTEEVLRSGWLHTGDIGSIDENGVARVSGREKNVINRGGVKIHPEEVDTVLERHTSILEACTFAIEDAIRGEIAGCALRTSTTNRLDLDELREWCTQHLRPHAIPERWFPLDAIPRNDRGKLNRERVREHCLEGTLPSPHSA